MWAINGCSTWTWSLIRSEGQISLQMGSESREQEWWEGRWEAINGKAQDINHEQDGGRGPVFIGVSLVVEGGLPAKGHGAGFREVGDLPGGNYKQKLLPRSWGPREEGKWQLGKQTVITEEMYWGGSVAPWSGAWVLELNHLDTNSTCHWPCDFAQVTQCHDRLVSPSV